MINDSLTGAARKLKVTIDGQKVEVEPGMTVLEAALKAGVYIPTLCYDADLKPYGACRLCIVEIEGMRGLLEDVSLDDWKYIINTNLMGYIRNITAFLPHFMERGSGYIVNVSSIQALGADTAGKPRPFLRDIEKVSLFCLAKYTSHPKATRGLRMPSTSEISVGSR